ncbi:uncharacterized protein B0T23DRAFT_236860 [Neurospora hispaniola]|uniref:Uncharacterized protein n=1 Tax=Neurospora hispaniola TaxID=588809 RepID=A0AAJ0I108_9PEZI|nr:hypothetical protein B0T23DRAFT_236860 [Neurospora hispaniola]
MYRLSGRSESPGPTCTVETMTEDMCRARALSVPCGGFNTSGFPLDGRDVSPAPSDSELSTPASSPPPLNPAYEYHAQAEDLLPDPHVSVDIEEASAASELASNLNTGSSRSVDDDHDDEEVHPVATASNDDDDLDFIFNIFTTAVQEYNNCTAILKQCEEETNAFQASTDSIRAFWRQKKAEMVAEVADDMDPALKKLERDLNAFQAKIDMRKASMVEAARRANAFMDRWTKFAADGTIE